jgi:hypothetical protein
MGRNRGNSKERNQNYLVESQICLIINTNDETLIQNKILSSNLKLSSYELSVTKMMQIP